jgi:Tfp pilus assembly protein PilF
MPTWAAGSQVSYDGPEHATARELVRQGREYASRQEDASAIRRFSDALVIDPTYGPAYVELGAARERTGDIDEAERVYERGIAYAPRFSGTYLARGELRQRRGERAQAAMDFETASRLGGGDARSLQKIAAHEVAVRAWPAALARYRWLATSAAVSHDLEQEHDASVQAAALSILCAELDPVRAGATGRGWVRASEASVARRRVLPHSQP